MNHANGFLGLVEEAKPRVKEITAAETAALMYGAEASRPTSLERGAMREPAGSQRAQIILIDVREDREWVAGHATGAVHLGRGVIERDIEQMIPNRETPLVLYCGGGYRSILAAESLQKMGYTNVMSMAGGWRDWCSAGFPVERE
ncbi:MAG: rhodanese-like domain-containing protein [Alphaproteobacteria bacterium]|nr:rhodanese-like domain-containing protein [Alphaproteobacteria bacterium]